MRFESFSCKPLLPLNLPVAGYGIGYRGKTNYDDLEMNGFSWSDEYENITIASVDSLYAGVFFRQKLTFPFIGDLTIKAAYWACLLTDILGCFQILKNLLIMH